jgi:Putative peptidoglycan binding domain/N-acetylmuramoyl-L-alanine amidase
MNRITWHHTGGGYVPNATDLEAYHRLIDGDGEVNAGNHAIEANAPSASMAAGTYAAHTRALNRGNIGLSVCCMARGVWDNPRASKAFPRPAQIDALVRETAALCRVYGIRPSREHTLSHAEVEPTLGVKQKNKWDFDYQILGVTTRDPIAIGDELRQEVALQLNAVVVMPPPSTLGAPLRQGSGGQNVVALQRALGVKADGVFGPKTREAVVRFQRSKNLLPDGIVSRMTWAALGL